MATSLYIDNKNGDALDISVEAIEHLGKFMKAEGITVIDIPGTIRICRHPNESLADATGKQAAAIEAMSKTPGGKKLSDDELLMDPMAGLEHLNG